MYQTPQQPQMQQFSGYAMPQAPQLPAPVIPANFQGVGMAANVPVNAWFANGPAYPAPAPMPVASPELLQAIAPPSIQTPDMFQAAPPQQAPPMQAPSMPPQQAQQPNANPMPADSRIETEVPLPSAANATEQDAAIAEEARKRNASMTVNYNHLRVLKPLGADYPEPEADDGHPVSSVVSGKPDSLETGHMSPHHKSKHEGKHAKKKPVTPKPDPAILELASNDDLDIATIARQAKKDLQKSPDEVEIRLH
jgi:hypothetical protein